MEHAFNTNIAKEYDLPIATILNNFKFWTIVNLANKRHIHDGLCWTFNSIPAFCAIFPYWTRHQIEHLLNKCKDLGLIVSGNYNNHKYDRTKWYALTGKAYKLFPELQQDEFITSLHETISEKTDMKLLHPDISEFSEMLLEKFREAFLKNPRPIPDINTDEKPDSKGESSNEADNHQEIPSPKTVKSKKSQFDIKAMLADNPHDIPESMLSDWMEVRKEKRQKVTGTAWQETNETLSKIEKQLRINPIEAFKKMVTKSWASLELEYFTPKDNGKTVDDFPAYI